MPADRRLKLIGERIVAEIGEIVRDYEGKGFGSTMGFVFFPCAPRDSVAAVREADELMYEVKVRSKGSFEVGVSGGDSVATEKLVSG